MFQLSSPSILKDRFLPKRYSSEGSNLSPPLEWVGTPPGTKELALLFEDVDHSEPHIHWLIYHIDPSVNRLSEGIPTLAMRHGSPSRQGRNSNGVLGYSGPSRCESDRAHHFMFKIFALSEHMNIPPGAEKKEVLAHLKNHVIATSEMRCFYPALETNSGCINPETSD